MGSNYKKLGPYIQIVNQRNSSLSGHKLLGVSIKKCFMPSIANIIGTDMSTYKLIRKKQFAYGPVTSRNGDKISIAILDDLDEAIVSQAYTVFEIKDFNELDPEYLMMWFRRPEFDRYARFKSHGSAREIFDWTEMSETELPVPNIEKQREIVREYNTIVNRISLNEQLIQKLEETAQAIYKQWFVEFEFPYENGKPYKSSGGKMVWCEELEKEIPRGWEVKTLDNFCECLDNLRKPLSGIQRGTKKGVYPYFGAMSIIDYIDSYIYDGVFLLVSEDGANVVDEFGRPATQYVWGKFWLNNHAHILKGINPYSTEFIKLGLSFINASHLVTGAAQPKINQNNLMSIELLKPGKSVLVEFNKLIKPLFNQIMYSTDQTKLLFRFNELLLSKMTKVEETM
ncbi:restriction endonuclease subunit S [Fluviicola taffensis]|uniref:Restriction modification system DNA specificity domain protein n=1 Tax=Fluviicola taffensis (strain DSM 16823 / NCIMB 13979 / RW262) TaxID=755732 RepID=F2IGZ6_FLUTR|nr:restriction endonuclease subunit S [Fluviicola taffensis]AEA44777.1 restriction modification system DNA specificity domain protein [Fluviicola taffensis DSM 16823]